MGSEAEAASGHVVLGCSPLATTTACLGEWGRLRYLLQSLHQLLLQVALSSLFLQILKSQSEMEGFCSQGGERTNP